HEPAVLLIKFMLRKELLDRLRTLPLEGITEVENVLASIPIMSIALLTPSILAYALFPLR
ncbi:MAG: hypothetical protein II526_07930, partial [Erysipelotrichaceae bacterium]|nr:hypothetical protein [Erysipelotrichaceae bacterium]